MASRIPKKTVALVLDRDGGFCVLRVSPDCLGEATCADHRANRQSGGAKNHVLDQPSNLVAACGICNGFKESGADREQLIGFGLRVESGRTHAHSAQKARERLVLYPNGAWYRLCDYGHKHKQLRIGVSEDCPDEGLEAA